MVEAVLAAVWNGALAFAWVLGFCLGAVFFLLSLAVLALFVKLIVGIFKPSSSTGE